MTIPGVLVRKTAIVTENVTHAKKTATVMEVVPNVRKTAIVTENVTHARKTATATEIVPNVGNTAIVTEIVTHAKRTVLAPSVQNVSKTAYAVENVITAVTGMAEKTVEESVQNAKVIVATQAACLLTSPTSHSSSSLFSMYNV